MFCRYVGVENVKTVFEVRDVHCAYQTLRTTLVYEDQ